MSETKLADLMLRQIRSWPSKLHPDEVAITLIIGAWLVMVDAYGEQEADDHLARAGAIAGARCGGGGGGGGPTHRMAA